jgi:RNA polymerase sigma factor (sigma-70 family)
VSSSRDPLHSQFEQWYEEGMPRLFNFVAYRLADRHQAEDLTSAICERALGRMDQYDPDRGGMDAWMFGIASNMVRNYLRRQRRRPKLVSLDALPEIRSNGATPEVSLQSSERFRKLVILLTDLPEKQQEAIALRYGAELSYAEMSDIMGVDMNYIGVLIHRARRALARALEEEDG